LRGIDVTIFDPTLDQDGFYGKQFANEFANILKAISTEKIVYG
jgi:hypothetical protein